MGIHIRRTPILAVLGMLALGGASVAAAQDTAAATRRDTAGYQPSGNQTDTSRTGGKAAGSDTSGYQYNGAATAMDTVVCKDGQNEANSAGGACGSHGGVDTAATWAAVKARGQHPASDTSSSKPSGTSP